MMLKMNLQLFAKDGPGGEKTEEATCKKLSDARKEGQVAKSKEIVNSVYLITIFYVIKFIIGWLGDKFIEQYNKIYNLIPTYASAQEDMTNIQTVSAIMRQAFIGIALMVAPIFAITFLIYFVGDLAQVKWKITSKPMMPKFSKINPLGGFKRMFSKQSLVNFVKSVAIVGVCLYMVCNTLIENYALMYELYDTTLIDGIELVGNLVIDLCIDISMVYVAVGIADLVFQRKKFKNDMMMTKQEVKDEYKNTEGDPIVKGQQKRRMREASQRRMMQQLPEADVVITNPTHFAVALKYDLSIAKAPVVIAKGEDFLAQKIKEVAREHKIEIYENKPLARALYHNVDIGQEIPEELYQAVAEVLAFVYNLKNK